MTLNTSIYVVDEVDPHEAFHELRRLIGATDEHTYTDKQDETWAETWADGKRFIEPGNPWTVSNDPLQGLPGWLFVHYQPDAPLRTQADQDAHDEDCNIPSNKYYEPEFGLCDGEHRRRTACWLEVEIDTAYSYRGPDCTGCADLHAALIVEFGDWLGDRNVRWKWKNEYSGEVFDGTDGLGEFVGHGAEADHWFVTKALPWIAAEMGQSS